MGIKTFEPTEDEQDMAFNAVKMQANFFSLDTDDKGISLFLRNQAEFVACLHAQARFLQAQIDHLEKAPWGTTYAS